MSFEQDFHDWLQLALQSDLPDGLEAFSFNLFEPASVDGVIFGVELIGAGEFDENDPDWACDEVWEPEQRQLYIPVEYSSADWEECLAKMKKLVEAVLQSAEGPVSRLKAAKEIGMGFVDGDIEILWQSR